MKILYLSNYSLYVESLWGFCHLVCDGFIALVPLTTLGRHVDSVVESVK